ncbi:von Willebrand factor type A domain-containing protein [Stachybotrys elegans]|uniref:von Willebrand factor type A domain-containing protein n=1 Tax=Stachybotrys elegans TaxID=80388 RepID=A0A8K0SKQ7_9HYPO|nr:von Willebrand factor type A domain-containing protein [Stachybotrys elegans]
MSIFAPGISWDPREPLPPELRIANGTPEDRPISRRKDVLANAPGVSPRAVNLIRLPSSTAPEVRESSRITLAPMSVSLDVAILEDLASVTVTQFFLTSPDMRIPRGQYTFPLPNNCTVTEFNCRIGTNRSLRGIIKSKRDAKKAFEDGVTAGHVSGLLEQNTPEIFTTSLGNIPAGTKVKVEIMFITLLKSRFADQRGTTTLIIPTCVASRYGTPGFTVATPPDMKKGLSLRIEIQESEAIKSIICKTHEIAVERDVDAAKMVSWDNLADDAPRHNRTALVYLESGSAFLDKDFVLDIETGSESTRECPKAWLEEHSSLRDHHALMLKLPGKVLFRPEPASSAGEVIFLVDRSGSMIDKMETLKSAMKFFLKGIPVGRRFNLWSFGSGWSSWCPQSVAYSEMSLNAALSYVADTFWANMGGTELLPALEALIQSRNHSIPTDILILTDGEVWRLDQTLQLIRETRRNSGGQVRFFSLGIGYNVSHALVEGIAKAGGGYAECIPPSQLTGWEDRVMALAKAAWGTKHLGPLQLTFNGINDKGEDHLVAAYQSPLHYSELSHFSGNCLWWLIEKPIKLSTLTVKAMTSDGLEASITVPIQHSRGKDDIVHRVAARSILNDLKESNNHELAEYIAKKWSLVSEWTSFCLVEQSLDDGDMSNNLPTNSPWINSAPSDDLLQERDLTWTSVLRVANNSPSRLLHLISPNYSSSRDGSGFAAFAPPPGLPYSDYPHAISHAISHALPPRDPDSMSSFGHIPPLVNDTLNSPAESSFRWQDPETALIKSPIYTIHQLLECQRFDGSFEFLDHTKVEKVLGSEVGPALLALHENPTPRAVIHTAAIIFLLERDFLPWRGLWEAMYDKAKSFLEAHGGDSLDMARIADVLKGRRMISDQAEARRDDSSSSLSAVDSWAGTNANQETRDGTAPTVDTIQEHSGRVQISCAPNV